MLSPSPSILAFDFGDKRIGVARAAINTRLPQPIATVENTPQLLDDIHTFIKKQNAHVLVVGLPRNMEGKETAQTAKARHFAQDLSNQFGLPVYLQDESLTSKQAETELKSRSVQYNKGHVDSLAANYILEDFVRAHPEVK